MRLSKYGIRVEPSSCGISGRLSPLPRDPGLGRCLCLPRVLLFPAVVGPEILQAGDPQGRPYSQGGGRSSPWAEQKLLELLRPRCPALRGVAQRSAPGNTCPPGDGILLQLHSSCPRQSNLVSAAQASFHVGRAGQSLQVDTQLDMAALAGPLCGRGT